MAGRDWSTAFRRASFRGVSFWVEDDDHEGGRRLSITDIAYGETPIVEDMGGRAKIWPILAYTAGDYADREALSLEEALNAPGASTLVLPMMAGRGARVLRFNRNRRKKVNGYVAFDVFFVEAGLSSVSFGTPLNSSPVAKAFQAGASVLSSALSG